MSKIVRAAMIAVLVAAPAFGAAATASTTPVATGIGWDKLPASATAGSVAVTSSVMPAQTNGIGWD